MSVFAAGSLVDLDSGQEDRRLADLVADNLAAVDSLVAVDIAVVGRAASKDFDWGADTDSGWGSGWD